MKNLLKIRATVVFILLILSSLKTFSQSLPADLSPSPLDAGTDSFGPWDFYSQNTALTTTTESFVSGNLPLGTYKLSVQNGDYGPALAGNCALLTNTAQKRQCQYDNLVESSARSFTRMSSATGTINGKKIFTTHSISQSISYFEEPITIAAANSLIVKAQGYPTAALKLGISSLDANAPPVALFSLNTLAGNFPLTVNFNASYSYSPTAKTMSYAWDAGDGTLGTGVKFSHVYTTAGIYQAKLTVTDINGLTSTFSAQIDVTTPVVHPAANKPPVVLMNVTYPDSTNLRHIHVSLAGSYDPDGFITSYGINFGDGTKVTGPEADHTFASDGTYLVQGKATDNQNGTSTKTSSLSIAANNNIGVAGDVYGPKIFKGSISGNITYNDSFTIPANSVSGMYRILVKNGDGLPHTTQSCAGLKGAASLNCSFNNLVENTYVNFNRVSGAAIYLNGQQLTVSGSISKTNYTFASEVALKASDTLKVVVNGLPTSWVQVEVQSMTVEDNSPAILTFQRPMSGDTIYTNIIPMELEVSASSNKPLASATVDQQSASVLNNLAIGSLVRLTNAGLNNITIQAVDLNGNQVTATESVNVVFSPNPPTIAVNLPANYRTDQAIIQVPIAVTDSIPTSTTVALNGVQVFTSNALSFSAPVSLSQQGINTITVQSTDAAGNISAVSSVLVTYDTTPPVLTQLAPANGSYTESMMIPISGTSNKALASASVNGLPLTLSAGGLNFSGNYVAGSFGQLALSYKLTDLAGNVDVINTTISVLQQLIVQNLVSVSADGDGKHMWIIGAASSARPGVAISAFSGLFGTTVNGTADASGAFALRLSNFNAATVKAYDSSVGESAQFNISFQGSSTLAGSVADSSGNPLVHASVGITNSPTVVFTDANGNFFFTSPPTGDQSISIDGSTAIMAPGSIAHTFSTTHVAVNIGIGQNNVLKTPIYLVPLMLDGTQSTVDATLGATVSSSNAAGVSIQIPAGAAAFPNGNSVSPVNIATVPSKYVTTPVPSSFVPKNVVSLEPSGTTFSQPIQLTLPNDNQLPAGTPMIVVSMNSNKGRWELGGQAQVSSDGGSVVTLPGQGITHFSSVYAVPLAPLIAAMKNPNLAGIDASQGGLTNSIQAPSFKVLGQSVIPSINYKSNWANPTVVVSDILAIPNSQSYTQVGNISQSGQQTIQGNFTHCQPVLLGTDNCYTEYYNVLAQTSYSGFWQVTNLWTPQSVNSQFFVGTTASDQVNLVIPGSVNASQANQLVGTGISNAAATQILQQTGIPQTAVVSYGLQLVDPSTGQYMSSGVHPSLARFQIIMQNLTITTNTVYSVSNLSINGDSTGLPVLNSNYTLTQVTDPALQALLPQDIQQDILVQNKVNSSAGRGWQLAGAERIYNPSNTKVMIEEASGAVSTYALNNTITTLFNGAGTTANLSTAVDLSTWPNSNMISTDGNGNYFASQVNLSSANPSVVNLGQLTSQNAGQLADQNYASCGVTYSCDSGGCRNFYNAGSFSPVTYNYGSNFTAGGVIQAGGGQIYFTNALGNSLNSFNGGTTGTLMGVTQNIDDFIYAQSGNANYFNQTSSNVSQACSALGISCTNPVTSTNTFSCDQANAHYATQYEYINSWICHGPYCGGPFVNGFNGTVSYLQGNNGYIAPYYEILEPQIPGFNTVGNWGYQPEPAYPIGITQTQSAQIYYQASNGQIGVPGSGAAGLNNPGAVIGSPTGLLVVADTGNNRVISIDPATNLVQVIAGNGQNSDYGDGGLAFNAGVYHPQGLAYDNNGNLYISTANGYIRKVDPYLNISTIAGLPVGTAGGAYGDQGAANTMYMSSPKGLVFDSVNQYLYVADSGFNRVLQINMQSGIANKVAGNGSGCSGTSPTGPVAGDGGPAIFASVCNPTTLGLDDQQNLLILDTGHQAIRRVTFGAVSGGSLAYSPSNSDLSKLFRNSDGTWTRRYRNGTVDSFDSNGYQIRSVDRVGHVSQFNYDNNYNLNKITYPNGQSLSYTYTSGQLTAVADPAGRVTTMNYLGNLLTSVNFPDGSSRSFQYDAAGQMTNETNQRGKTTQYAYNAWNRLSTVTRADGTTEVINDIASQTIANSYSGGTVGSMQGVGTGQSQASTQVTNGNNVTTKMTPDFMGFISSITDALGNVTSITRDYLGRPITIKKPDGTVTTMTYDQTTGDLLSTTDNALGITTSSTYDSYGNKLTSTDGNGRVTINAYDQATGLLLQTTYPNGNVVAYTYNSQGLVLQKIVVNTSSSILTTYSYDRFGNVTAITDNGGNHTNFQNDLAGNQIQATSNSTASAMQVTGYSYDAFNRLTSVTSPKNEVTSYSYWKTGVLRQITDPKGGVTEFKYDLLERLAQKTDPLGNTFKFTYDGNSNRISETDPNGNVKTYTYDVLNRMIQAVFPDDIVVYQYDIRNNVIMAANNVSQVNNTYDTQKRLTFSETFGEGAMASYPTVPMTYTYDGNNNKTSFGFGPGSIDYTYDGDNRLTSVNGNYFFSYDVAGRLIQTNRSNGQTNYSYTASGTLASIQHTETGGYQDFENLTYDQRNFPISKQNSNGTYNYGYDANGQLTSATNPDGIAADQESFTYDGNGNRLTDAMAHAYGYDSKGQRLLDDGVYVYTYDNNGNIITQINHDPSQIGYNFTYNSKNQLIQTIVLSGTFGPALRQVNYVYDVLGRRMQKSVIDNSAPNDITKTYTRQYVYDGQNIFEEYDGSQTLLAVFIYNPTRLDDLLFVSAAQAGITAGLFPYSDSFLALKDHLGSVTAFVGWGGNLVQTFDYRSFGSIAKVADASGNDVTAAPPVNVGITFAGREFDSETGLYYNRARYYSPGTGRFLQADPQSGNLITPIAVINKYIYAANNPMLLTDPTGKDFFGIVGSVLLGGLLGPAFTLAGIENNEIGGNYLTQLFSASIGEILFAAAAYINPESAALGLGLSIAKASAKKGNFFQNLNDEIAYDGATTLAATYIVDQIDLVRSVGTLNSVAAALVSTATLYGYISPFIGYEQASCDPSSGGSYSSDLCSASRKINGN